MIPQWNSAGVIPPIRPGQAGHSADRSPYVVSLSTFVEHFATSPERIDILEGFLNYRAELHKLGLSSGFQWIDGSFLEEIEVLESRNPRDVDVVTFVKFPDGETQATLYGREPKLFDHAQVKTTYMVDHYLMELGQPTESWNVRNIAYWYSMWSHRRDGLWKGFVQIDIDPSQDAEARAALEANKGEHHAQ